MEDIRYSGWRWNSPLAKLLRVLEQSPHCFTTWCFLVPVWIVSTRISSTLKGVRSWLPPVCEVVLRHERSGVEQRALSHSVLRRKAGCCLQPFSTATRGTLLHSEIESRWLPIWISEFILAPQPPPQITTHTQYARWLADLLPRISQPVTLLISDVSFTVYSPCFVPLVCTSAWSSAKVWLIYQSDALLSAGRSKLIVLLKASCSHPALPQCAVRLPFFWSRPRGELLGIVLNEGVSQVEVPLIVTSRRMQNLSSSERAVSRSSSAGTSHHYPRTRDLTVSGQTVHRKATEPVKWQLTLIHCLLLCMIRIVNNVHAHPAVETAGCLWQLH